MTSAEHTPLHLPLLITAAYAGTTSDDVAAAYSQRESAKSREMGCVAHWARTRQDLYKRRRSGADCSYSCATRV
ncbi:hypothetical protein DFJ73DRAFT_827373, partial [Zopfochytrium polystomum]